MHAMNIPSKDNLHSRNPSQSYCIRNQTHFQSFAKLTKHPTINYTETFRITASYSVLCMHFPYKTLIWGNKLNFLYMTPVQSFMRDNHLPRLRQLYNQSNHLTTTNSLAVHWWEGFTFYYLFALIK